VLAKTVAKDFAETKNIIFFLIDNLPGIHTTAEKQLETLKELEEVNRIEGDRLKEAILNGDNVLSNIQTSLDEILDNQYESYSRTESNSILIDQHDKTLLKL
jgi:hypothetical protein